MADNVTTIADFQQRKGRWISGPAVCVACKHEWIACYPVGTFEFECPKCSAYKGVGKTFLGSDDYMYKCNCGCFIFSIKWQQGKEPEIMCAGCGEIANNWQ